MDTLSPITGWLGEQLEPLGRLLLAALLGSVLGAEREFRGREAGLRTNTLIALGSALFTLIAIHMADESGGDPARIPAQIVTGIGFLGGGAILRWQGDIRGLTTAATIWVNAAVGMAAGAGYYSLAVTSTVATLVVLVAFVRFEGPIAKRRAANANEANANEANANEANANEARANEARANEARANEANANEARANEARTVTPDDPNA